MKKQIRWKQRFSNFQKSYDLLKRFAMSSTPSEMEQMARIQAFEICFELSWKTLKDYFYQEGQILNSPRSVIKQAVQDSILSDGRQWLDALESRNTTAHAYDEEVANEIASDIRKEYLDIFQEFEDFFLNKK